MISNYVTEFQEMIEMTRETIEKNFLINKCCKIKLFFFLISRSVCGYSHKNVFNSLGNR